MVRSLGASLISSLVGCLWQYAVPLPACAETTSDHDHDHDHDHNMAAARVDHTGDVLDFDVRDLYTFAYT
jgi:hypothetical protein